MSKNFPLIIKEKFFENFRKPEKKIFFFNSLMTALYSYEPKIDSGCILAKIKMPKLKSEKIFFRKIDPKFAYKMSFLSTQKNGFFGKFLKNFFFAKIFGSKKNFFFGPRIRFLFQSRDFGPNLFSERIRTPGQILKKFPFNLLRKIF